MTEAVQTTKPESVTAQVVPTYDDIAAEVACGVRERFDVLSSEATPDAVRAIVDTQDKGVLQKTMNITELAINAFANFYGEQGLAITTRRVGQLFGFAEFLIGQASQGPEQTRAQDTISFLEAAVEPREHTSPVSLMRSLIAKDLAYDSHYTRSLAVAMLGVRIWTIEHSTDKEQMTSYYDAVRAERFPEEAITMAPKKDEAPGQDELAS
jgi:hypothetical protein